VHRADATVGIFAIKKTTMVATKLQCIEQMQRIDEHYRQLSKM
jgi:hypothetical protein